MEAVLPWTNTFIRSYNATEYEMLFYFITIELKA